jgi:hypothetical protein
MIAELFLGKCLYFLAMFGLAENDNNQTDVGACLLDYCDRAMFMVSGEQVGLGMRATGTTNKRLASASQANSCSFACSKYHWHLNSR